MPDETTLGARLRRIRRERRLSQEQLAERAGISVEMVRKTEQGRRYPRIPVLMRIAQALDTPLSELADNRPRLDGAAEGASVLALRDVLLSPSVIPGLGMAETGEPSTAQRLQAAADDAGATYWQGDFPRMAAILPGLIASARLTREEAGAGAASALAQLYDLSAALLVHLGKEDLAAVAAERAISAAASAGDERLHAMMQGTYAWVLLHQGRLEEAERIAAAAADRIEPPFSAPAEHIAAWGSLLMTALGPAAAAGRDTVEDYIRLASAGAERLGRRVRVYQTSFAPATVHMQATYAYAVAREPGRALEAAGRVRPGDLPGTISRGRHLLDVAQAHADARHGTEATAVLAKASALAPVWFRHQGVARVLVSELLEQQHR
ncbi:MAG: helix-turn-helix domain-containing protein, partial [Streptosporangiaceae bacterium]